MQRRLQSEDRGQAKQAKLTLDSDYPNFYPRLYTLLTPSLLHSKYRARFFRLLDTFLRSTLLPSALVASFIKRLSRIALTAPPAGVIIVVPFVYNLFKRHKGCMVMLQRYEADEEGELAGPWLRRFNARHGYRVA